MRARFRHQFPVIGEGDEFFEELEIRGMAGLIGDNMAVNRESDQREVADQIQYLMANEFIFEAETGAIQDTGVAEDDRVIGRTTPCKAVRPETFDVFEEPECSRRCDFHDKALFGQIDAHLLLAEKMMVELDPVRDASTLERQSRDFGVSVRERDGMGDPDERSFLALLRDAAAQDEVCQSNRAAVENGDFRAVDFDEHIVYPETGECGEQMLNGPYFCAVQPDRCRERRVGDRTDRGSDHAVLVFPQERDARVAGCGFHANRRMTTGVQSDAFEAHFL